MTHALTEADVRRIVREELENHDAAQAALIAAWQTKLRAELIDTHAPDPSDGPLVAEMKEILRRRLDPKGTAA